MSWKDDLLPASFRRVDFYYRDVDMSGGRNVAEHEFALRDDGATEDMGRKLRHYRVSAYLIGDDYLDSRYALLSALETAGTGTLVHPFDGPLSVKCIGFTLHESDDEGGICYFDIDFVEDGAVPSPSSSVSTSTAASSAATSAQSAASDTFLSTYSLSSYGAMISSYAKKNTTLLTSDCKSVIDGLSIVADSAAALKTAAAQIEATYLSVGSLAESVTGYFTSWGDAIIDGLPDGSVDETTNSRGGQPIGDPSYGLAAMAAWSDTESITGTTAWQQQAASNNSALTVLVQSCAVAQLARVYAATEFAGSVDAETARDQLTEFITALAVSAADNGDDAAYLAWMALLQASTDDLTTRGKQLPDVVTITTSESLPALVLAQQLYADASRAGEIISRNSAPHPLFLSTSLEVLTE